MPAPTPAPTPIATAIPTPAAEPTPHPEPAKPVIAALSPPSLPTAKSSTRTTLDPPLLEYEATTKLLVHGTVKGGSAGSVTITLQVRRGKRWTGVRDAHASITTVGDFTRELGRLADGRYRVRATYRGTSVAKASLSSYRSFTLS